MINIEKTLVINSALTKENFKDDSLIIDIPLCENYCDLLTSTQNNTAITPIRIKNNDKISIHLSIENNSSLKIEKLQLNFIDNNNFKFISGSFINSDSKEAYTCQCINSNCICTNIINPNEKKTFEFFIKTFLNNYDIENLNKIFRFICPSILPQNKFITDKSLDTFAIIDQAALKITEDSAVGKIIIENTGNAPAEDFIYRYNIPKILKTDFSNINATLNNTPISIFSKKFDDYVIFKIDNIPPKLNNSPSKLIISFKSYNPNSIYFNKVTLK